MGTYAERTHVPPKMSRDEIERALAKAGARGIMVGYSDERGLVAFEMRNRQVKFILPLPKITDPNIASHASGKRSRAAAEAALDQAIRQRWRALLLGIKAKLASVEAGVEIFESAFLAQVVMPDGRTLGDHALPQIETAYKTGRMQPLLPDYSGKP